VTSPPEQPGPLGSIGFSKPLIRRSVVQIRIRIILPYPDPELRVLSYQLQVTSYELRVTRYELRVTKFTFLTRRPEAQPDLRHTEYVFKFSKTRGLIILIQGYSNQNMFF
jgi:hypothetical protein